MAKPGLNHYPTPPEATRALLSVERFPGGIWEPCAGSGDMAAVLREAGYTVRATTVEAAKYDPKRPKFRVQGGVDFLDEVEASHPNIVTNPPYNRAEAILRHALSLGPAKVALFLNIKFLASETRARGLWREHPPARVWVVGDRVSMFPAEWDGARNSTTETHAWFVWELPQRQAMPGIGWLLAKDFKGSTAGHTPPGAAAHRDTAIQRESVKRCPAPEVTASGFVSRMDGTPHLTPTQGQ